MPAMPAPRTATFVLRHEPPPVLVLPSSLTARGGIALPATREAVAAARRAVERRPMLLRHKSWILIVVSGGSSFQVVCLSLRKTAVNRSRNWERVDRNMPAAHRPVGNRARKMRSYDCAMLKSAVILTMNHTIVFPSNILAQSHPHAQAAKQMVRACPHTYSTDSELRAAKARHRWWWFSQQALSRSSLQWSRGLCGEITDFVVLTHSRPAHGKSLVLLRPFVSWQLLERYMSYRLFEISYGNAKPVSDMAKV